MVDPITIGVVGWGVSAVGWVVSPIISSLLNKGFDYLGYDVSKKLRQLEPKVLLLERVIEVVDVSPYRPRLELLFKNLKSAFYEAEDILDDMEYCRLERKIQDDKLESGRGAHPPKRNRMKVLSAVAKCSPLKNKETGLPKRKLKDSLENIEDIINKAYKFVKHLNLSPVSNVNGSQAVPVSSGGAVTTAAPPIVVIGRDKDRDKIIAMLHEKEGDGQPNTNSGLCYSVIGIHGIGGSGKSTLAQLVCAREKNNLKNKKDGHFDLVMWVHVSQSFNVGAIFKEIFEAATKNSCPQLNNLNTLQDKLEEELHGKRFLLVLDDIWCNINDERQKEDLRQILSPLIAGEGGSKILVTSRTEDALIVLGATKPRRIPISDLDDDVFHSLLMHYALQGAVVDDHVRRRLNAIGADIATKLKGSPLAARIAGGRLGRRTNGEFWTTVKNMKLMDGTMGALWWSFQHLDQQCRRCFAYCSIFPRRHRLNRDELVKLWVAEGFVRSTNEGEDMEDVCRGYFDELVSISFLQPEGRRFDDETDCYLIHDLLHDLAEAVAGSDCFRIENDSSWKVDGRTRDCWSGDVPRDVRYLFVRSYDGELITEKILQLENLRTLIIYAVRWDTAVEEKVIESISKRLPNLRVLAIALSRHYNLLTTGPRVFSVPESIDQLKHLRYLAFRHRYFHKAILPSTATKLYHMQLLDLGHCNELEFSCGGLVNLRHVFSCPSQGPSSISNIRRLTSLQTIPSFTVKEEQGYEVTQLRDLNKLRGSLHIHGLENVESKEEALEANLAAKEWLTHLSLNWGHNSSCNPEVQAEVLEGLCPPVGLHTLETRNCRGSRYPDWMVGKQNGGPKDLQKVWLYGWSQLGPAPELKAFTHLRSLWLWKCSWEGVPGNMKHLTSLKELSVYKCMNIRSLPTLPKSLQEFHLNRSNNAFMKSCYTVGHPNWQKIEHVTKKRDSSA